MTMGIMPTQSLATLYTPLNGCFAFCSQIPCIVLLVHSLWAQIKSTQSFPGAINFFRDKLLLKPFSNASITFLPPLVLISPLLTEIAAWYPSFVLKYPVINWITFLCRSKRLLSLRSSNIISLSYVRCRLTTIYLAYSCGLITNLFHGKSFCSMWLRGLGIDISSLELCLHASLKLVHSRKQYFASPNVLNFHS